MSGLPATFLQNLQNEIDRIKKENESMQIELRYFIIFFLSRSLSLV